MRQIIILTFLLTTISCNTDSSSKQNKGHFLSDTSDIKNWLIKTVGDYRNQSPTEDSDKKLRAALTEDYYNYKSTDITLEYDTLTKDQFNDLWKSKFKTQYVGKNGFFDWSQDSGPIEIHNCNFVKQMSDSSLTFHLVMKDTRWNIISQMDITVIKKNNLTLISDVKHLD